MTLERRSFLKLLGMGAGAGAVGAVGLAGCASKPVAVHGKKVVVVGGGYGGTIAAKYIRMMDPTLEVTLIERNDHFVSCPFSNLVLGGMMPDLSKLTIKYDKLAANHGIKVVQAEVTGVDPVAHTVTTSKGVFPYSRLVLSPGIEFRTDEIKGYDENVTPHAWKAGPQTLLLKKQLEAMKPGENVIISIPVAPFRCPPGPYERTSMIAMFLKEHKPGSKVIVLDGNPDIVSKKGLFLKGWKKHYEGIVDYRPAKKVTEVVPGGVLIEGLEEVKGAVINVIPPQKAGHIAHVAGVVGPDKKWCPVNPMTFESTIHKDIHVIGDSSIAGAMPKSGYSANSEAKVCATNIVNLMNGREITELSAINTCYSYLSRKEAVSVTGVYRVNKEKHVIEPVPGSVGVSPDLSETEAVYAESWLRNILTEMST
ncbi:MAG: NAD(P)/FAD-dependent oxidoreductase [Candidatus Nitricoxidivorans perseverans]|uniref:NAD(P)/FAD-dependent oxidoreductase n=1 Tax=Candidatus Nitricoxidivorans perseverans TaxID=2975601 RepID=A0AA49J267_9PROT|nr:MAG: NAD(P)/FAD-dependent oxidoreductase [Candidatus Nitricoxidivorans perseverans]